MIEFITIVDHRRKKIGLKSRADVHRDGDWHETFHCWMTDRDRLLLQLRSDTKADFPALFDITAAGHLSAGETVRDGVREIQEELGLELTLDQLTPLGVFEDIIETDTFLDREFAHTYVYAYDGEAFMLDETEVADVVSVEITALHALIDETRAEVETTSVISGETRSVTKQHLVPHPMSYWKQVLAGVKAAQEERHD
ncbi:MULTISPECIES: NUDIX hydrolase [Exiguobacterium]|uniref:NUDIX hydrolase n=1 Tax=Exiguobacterium TaxID=33986 RepID=UPI001BE84384|nr:MULTISPECIES: NUDIX domain-containing protein [Exiguobacterium]MCT4777996.1 NUDIX domain-containing protein [Exiguobacterium aquaticum]MCT4790233.1 NUDIX domain-containing protein [Exiguobacterium mexicanum]